LFRITFIFANSHARPENGGEMKIRPVNQNARILGFKEMLTASQSAKDLATMANTGELMTKPALASALPQELRILSIILTSANLHALTDNGGNTRTTNAILPVPDHGRPSLKKESRFVLSHALLDSGGETKIRLANLSVKLHGYQELPLMVFQPALDHALRDRCGDLTTSHAVLNAQAQESRTLRMILTSAKYHAQLDNGGELRTANVFLFAKILGSQLLKMAF